MASSKEIEIIKMSTEATENITSLDYYPYEYENDMTAQIQENIRNPFVIIILVMCLIGIVANSLSVLGTLCIPHGQTTHSKLIVSLAIADTLIVFSLLFRMSIKFLIPNHRYFYHHKQDPQRVAAACALEVDRAFNNTALIAILLNLLTMAVDHSIAIMKPLYYSNMMSNKRGNIIIIFLWIVAISCGFLNFIAGLLIKTDETSMYNFCETIAYNLDIELFVYGLVILVLIIMTYIYIRIYFEVKHLTARDHMLQQDTMHSSKAIITTILIVGTFVICWVPYDIFQIVMLILTEQNHMYVLENFDLFQTLNNVFYTLMLSNSICDPIIYAIRLRDVQLGYKNLLNKIFKHRRYSMNEENFTRSRRNTSFLTDDEPTEVARCIDGNRNIADEQTSNMTELSPVSGNDFHPWNDLEKYKKTSC